MTGREGTWPWPPVPPGTSSRVRFPRWSSGEARLPLDPLCHASVSEDPIASLPAVDRGEVRLLNAVEAFQGLDHLDVGCWVWKAHVKGLRMLCHPLDQPPVPGPEMHSAPVIRVEDPHFTDVDVSRDQKPDACAERKCLLPGPNRSLLICNRCIIHS